MTEELTREITLRDHARGAVRDEVMRQAWILFADQGFEATTVDQIAEAAGMSRRTFFRYFAGKDELVVQRLTEAGDRIAEALQTRPARERAWPALRAAFDEVVAPQDLYADRARLLQLMLRNEPGLRASITERRRRWEELLVPIVAASLPAAPGRRGPDIRAVALTASALACLEAAEELWAAHPGTRLADLLDDAMGAVGPLA